MDDRPPSGSRSPGAGASAYGTKQNVQTSHREVDLTVSATKAFADPNDDASCSPPGNTLYNSRKARDASKDTVVGIDGADLRRPSNSSGTMVSSDRHYVEPGLNDSGLAGDRPSIPSDGTFEVLAFVDSRYYMFSCNVPLENAFTYTHFIYDDQGRFCSASYIVLFRSSMFEYYKTVMWFSLFSCTVLASTHSTLGIVGDKFKCTTIHKGRGLPR